MGDTLALELPHSRPAKITATIKFCAAGYPHAEVMLDVGDRQLEIDRIFGAPKFTAEDCRAAVREKWKVEPALIRKREGHR